MRIKNYIDVKWKKYPYFIEKIDNNISKIICKDANINQEFLNEDLVNLLNDLPNLIVAEQKYKEKQDSIIRFRISWIEKIKLQQKAKKSWYNNISAFIRNKVLD